MELSEEVEVEVELSWTPSIQRSRQRHGRSTPGMGGGAGALGTVAADDCDIDVLDPFRSGSMLMKRSRYGR